MKCVFGHCGTLCVVALYHPPMAPRMPKQSGAVEMLTPPSSDPGEDAIYIRPAGLKPQRIPNRPKTDAS